MMTRLSESKESCNEIYVKVLSSHSLTVRLGGEANVPWHSLPHYKTFLTSMPDEGAAKGT